MIFLLAYLKLKTNNTELYENEYLEQIKQKQCKIFKLQYYICKLYFEFIVKLKYYFNIITIKQIYDSYLFILPFSEINKSKKLEKCIKKVKKIMYNLNVKSLVADEKIKQNKKFIQLMELETKKIHILDGRGIMPYLIKEILEYILKKQNIKTEQEDLFICVKENNQLYIDNIKYLLKYFKTINIITPKIKEFQNLADKIEEQENIIITVTNNKKKSLKKAKLIVNFDYLENEINKYNIYRNAIILTINEKGFYENNTFSGIQIRKIKIDTSNKIKEKFKKYKLLENNDLTILYESLVNKNQNFTQIKTQMKNDNIQVIELYGKNGVF